MGMRMAIALCVTLLAATVMLAATLWMTPSVRAQQPQEPAPTAPATAAARTAQDDAPVALPAEALAYAAELEKQASPKLLDWAKKHARNLLRDEFTADELTSESIARVFPAQPAATQEAIRFLVGYEAYRRASDHQEARAAYLHDLDRDIANLDHRIRLLESMGAPIGSAAAVQRENNLDSSQRRREQLEIQRRLAVSSEEVERKRVDVCLRWLAAAYPGVKDTPAQVLHAVPAPRN